LLLLFARRHKSIATLQRYMQSTDLFALDPLAGAV
jgi:hypothetical protein